jgi:hypothetical protein
MHNIDFVLSTTSEAQFQLPSPPNIAISVQLKDARNHSNAYEWIQSTLSKMDTYHKQQSMKHGLLSKLCKLGQGLCALTSVS